MRFIAAGETVRPMREKSTEPMAQHKAAASAKDSPIGTARLCHCFERFGDALRRPVALRHRAEQRLRAARHRSSEHQPDSALPRALAMLLRTNLAVTCALVGLIWTIQLVHYPLFSSVGAPQFAAFHRAHTERISWIVLPLMCAELLLAIALAMASERVAPRWSTGLALALVLGAWASTALLSVPIHNAVATANDGERASLLARLVVTNWPRTLAWTARAALLFWLSGR
jgi:hypothetical protein